jgi:hypothetical protein
VFAVDGAAPVISREALATLEGQGQPTAVAPHARTTRGLGSAGYLSPIRAFHRNQREKSELVRVHAMKNQWLMLLKNGDGYNFTRDFPFILAREAFVIAHNLLFNPSALVAVPMTLRMLPATLRARRAIKARRRVPPRALRQWLESGGVGD